MSAIDFKHFSIASVKNALNRINKKAAFSFVFLLLLVISGIVLTDGLIALGRVHPGIKVAGIEVGGMTPSKATEKLQLKLIPAFKEPVTIRYQENEWQVTPEQFDAKMSIPKSVTKAYAAGREGSFVHQLQQRLSYWIKTKELSLVFSADYKLMGDLIEGMAKKIDQNPVDAGIKITDGEPKITPSEIGIKLNRAESFALIRTKLVSFRSRQVEAPVTIIPVEITEEGAKDALKDTKEMMRFPLDLQYSERGWRVEREEIGNLIRFRKVPGKKKKKALRLLAEPDPEKVKSFIETITKDVTVEPQNAEFVVDGKVVNIAPSRNGIKIDTDIALAKIKKVLFSDPPRQIILTTKVVEPERTTEEAEAMGIKERVSVFTTTFSSGNAPRVNNIILLSKDLDDTIVAPGKVFSFNETIGPRTAEKGYKEAPTIVQGELVPSVGGGVCQVATTLFNTAFFAGYTIISRQNHSFYIDHYPAGRDATVSWGSPDLKFKNDTDAYLLIKTWPSSSSITIAIYSTGYGTEVSYKASDFTNFKPFPTKYVEDPTLPKGQENAESGGIEGRDITVFRTVKRGGKMIREDKFFSRYKPKQAVVRVGTMEAPPPELTTEETQTVQ